MKVLLISIWLHFHFVNSFLSSKYSSLLHHALPANTLEAVTISNSAEVVTNLHDVKNSWALKQYGKGDYEHHSIECIEKMFDDDSLSVQVAHTGGLGLIWKSWLLFLIQNMA